MNITFFVLLLKATQMSVTPLKIKMLLWFLLLGIASVTGISSFSYLRGRQILINRTSEQLTAIHESAFMQTNDKLNAAHQKSLLLSALNHNRDTSVLFDSATNAKGFASSALLNHRLIGSSLNRNKGLSLPDSLFPSYTELLQHSKSGGSRNFFYPFGGILFSVSVIETEAGDTSCIVFPAITGGEQRLHSDGSAFSELISFTLLNSTRMKDELVLNESKKFKNGNGEWMKAVYSEILAGGCLVQLETQIPLKSVMAPVRNLLPEVILLALFTSLLLVVLSWLVTRKLTRTLSALTSAVSDIVNGNYDVKLDPQQNDEIGNLSNAFVEMADHIRKTTLELREREERLAHFYDATIDGIVLHDNGKPLLVNQALCRLTGFSEEELMQKDVYKHLIKPSNYEFRLPVRPYSYETEATRKNGSLFPVEVQESAIEYSGGMIKASVIRDITKRAEMEKQLLLERHKKLSWVIDGQELERQRLSRELHDGLGQSLIGLKLRLESIPDPEDSATAQTLNDLRKLFDKTIEEIRQISNDLMPAGLNEFGLINALRKLCDNTEMNAGIRVHFKAGAETAHLALSRKTNAYMYRIAQEAMNNTMKHAAASEISVEIFSDAGRLFLNIADNGKGFKFGKTHSYVGNGLYNMRERAGLLGGSFEIFSEPGKGTLVKVSVPVQEKQIHDE